MACAAAAAVGRGLDDQEGCDGLGRRAWAGDHGRDGRVKVVKAWTRARGGRASRPGAARRHDYVPPLQDSAHDAPIWWLAAEPRTPVGGRRGATPSLRASRTPPCCSLRVPRAPALRCADRPPPPDAQSIALSLARRLLGRQHSSTMTAGPQLPAPLMGQRSAAGRRRGASTDAGGPPPPPPSRVGTSSTGRAGKCSEKAGHAVPACNRGKKRGGTCGLVVRGTRKTLACLPTAARVEANPRRRQGLARS